MIYCVFLGTFKDKRLRDLAFDFHLRLKRLWPVTIVEIAEKQKDLEKWASPKKNRGDFISLDPGGEPLDTGQFAKWTTRSSKDLYFLAWGAEGPLPGKWDFISKNLSLSPMTYSHEIARVLLMEQLYRAGATLKGHPYAR
jgi:23S rRNA (pseudouridine1915-N3)-methyltransferase